MEEDPKWSLPWLYIVVLFFKCLIVFQKQTVKLLEKIKGGDVEIFIFCDSETNSSVTRGINKKLFTQTDIFLFDFDLV